MAASKQDLVDLSDEVWERLDRRLANLTDDEYFWEPVPGCWNVRTASGVRRADNEVPAPEPPPFTTLAWRLWHLIDLYGEDRAPAWLAVEPQGPAIGLDDQAGVPPGSAATALEVLGRAHDRWDAHLRLVSDAALAEQIGPVAGPYGERTRAAYVLHMLDEFIHHGAEIALLRDLWRCQRSVPSEP